MRNLFILRGAPGSGKSTWIKENNLEPYTLSADTIRLMYQSPITTPEGDLCISQNHDTAVWRLLFELLERRMDNGEMIIIDATHYKSSLISRYKDLVSKYRYRVNVVDFSTVPMETCLERNKNRDSYKYVPEDVIEKMYACLHDDTEVKKSYKVLTPEEAIKMINSSLEAFDANEYEKIVIFGDIHGCYDPLKEYFDKNPFNENYNYIFCGDYLDRGLQNKEVLEFLISLKDKKNCVFLEGNHEKWLRIYSQKDYDMDYYENRPIEYKDLFVTKLISQLKDRQVTLEKKINKNKNMSEELSKLLRESWETDPENKEVFYRFEKINVPEKQKELHKEIQEWKYRLEKLTRLITLLQHEEYSTKRTIEELMEFYEDRFDTSLSFDITNILEKNYNMESKRKQNPIRSLEFIKRTYPQIKDIDKTEIRRFCDRLAQMSYFTFNGHCYLVTHGGVPCMPTIKTATNELIKGVGKYEDHDKIDKQFNENEEKVSQIHGHRNVLRVTTISNDGRTFNLEGQVEFGGNLRIIELEDCGGDITNFHIEEIKNNNFIPEDKEEVIEKSDLELLKEMYDSKWVQIKNLKDNVISFNFTRDAFEKDKWNTITTKARGLFVDKTDGHIVGRSFDKFFNYRQHETTESAYMKEHIKWPLTGYKKENGFLGIVSKDVNGIHFFTKSSDDGDYVNWFIGVLCDNYGITYLSNSRYSDIYNKLVNERDEIDKINSRTELNILKTELTNKLSPLLDEGYSYVFECVDKDNDPHIIKYKDNKVVLLEVFKNQLKEEHVSYEELCKIATNLNVKVKDSEWVFYNWESFEEWKDKFRQGVTQWDCKHEGYVFEDQNGYRVKFKSSFYNFWKQMRAVKDALAGGRTNKKVYKTKEEIQVVKLMEELGRDRLKEMSIIDVEDMFYERYKDVLSV